MSKGIIILAQGPQKYYEMAANLCASIKVHSKLPVCLVAQSPILIPGNDMRAFDHVRTLDSEHCHPFYAKTVLNQYTPFKESLYIDADSLCISDPAHLFDKFTDDFNVIVNKAQRYPAPDISMNWAVPGKVMDYYGFTEGRVFSELQTSAILWRGKQGSDIFKLAEHYYASDFYPDFNGLAPEDQVKKGLGWYPDELAFEVALLAANYVPDKEFQPIYFQYGRDKGRYFSWTTAAESHPFFSLPGGTGNSPAVMWKVYDRLRQNWAREASHRISGEYASLFNRGRGYQVQERDKAANKVPPVRFDGLRRRYTPKKIKNLIYTEPEK